MSQRAFFISLAASLLLHMLVFSSLTLFKLKRPEPTREVEVTLLETPPSTKVPPKLQQIVDQQEKSANDEESEKAKYLSRHNQHVLKETKAANYGKFVNSDNGSQGQANPQQTTSPSTTPEVPTDKPLARGPGKLPKLKDLKPNLNWSREAFAQQTGQGPSQTDDHIKDAEAGPQTLLNTREFVYYSYYSRIKERLRQYWEPKIKDKISRLLAQGRTIASDQDRVTKMIITLDNKGTLIKVQIIGESGIQDLDEAAIEAFRAAAPFPHPPTGLVESDGNIRIRWDFVLEANNGLFHVDRFAQQEDR